MSRPLAFMFFSLIILTSCHQEKKTSLTTIDMLDGLKNQREFNLSEIADDVEYVKLETNDSCLLGDYCQAIVTPSHIICNQFRPSKDILVFDRKGRFLNHVGREGEGPGEYVWISYLAVNPLRPEIIIADNTLHRLSRFSLSGSLINEVSTEKLFGQNIAGLCFDASGNIQILLQRPMEEVTRFALIRTLDYSLKVIGEFMYISTHTEDGVGSGWPSFYRLNGILHFREYWRDTIYQLNPNGFEPKYRLFFSELAQPAPLVNRNERDIYNQLLLQFEVSDYLIFYVSLPEQKTNDDIIVVYQKETGELFRPKPKNCCTLPKGYPQLIHNDIDGFLPVSPAPTQDGFLVATYGLIYLKQCLVDGCPLKAEIKFPDKRKELIDLINNSKDDDNPILQIFHLK